MSRSEFFHLSFVTEDVLTALVTYKPELHINIFEQHVK